MYVCMRVCMYVYRECLRLVFLLLADELYRSPIVAEDAAPASSLSFLDKSIILLLLTGCIIVLKLYKRC